MSDVKVKLNRSGVRELMQSPEMMAICRELADAAAARLGTGYEVTARTGKRRVNAEIRAASRNAIKENAKSNTILKALK